MELWDLRDRDRQLLGRTMVRGDEQPEGTYHDVVHICMFNSRGEMLIQHRQPFKDGWSNMWDITLGGSTVSGENSREGAHRELLEELGIDYDFSNIRPALTINGTHIFDDFYLIDGEPEISSLRCQPEEVSEARWATHEEILSMIDAGTFIPYHKCFIDLLFTMHVCRDMRFREDGTARGSAPAVSG